MGSTGVSSEFCDLESELKPVSSAVLSSATLFWCTSGVGREFDLTSFGVLPRGREKGKKNYGYMQKSDYNSESWHLILCKKRNEDVTWVTVKS